MNGQRDLFKQETGRAVTRQENSQIPDSRAALPLSCASCGGPIEAHFTRGALVACLAPPRIYYRGRHLELSPMQTRIMVELVQFGGVSFEDLARLSKVNSLQGIFVAATALRKRLPSGIHIITRRRWGYMLEQLQ